MLFPPSVYDVHIASGKLVIYDLHITGWRRFFSETSRVALGCWHEEPACTDRGRRWPMNRSDASKYDLAMDKSTNAGSLPSLVSVFD